MAEDVNVEEEEIEEEEEEQSGADAQQTLDDLTVLNDSTAPIDDPESQVAGDDTLEWEEPAASQSLATIHTGSRPTDAEIMANLVPEGESIIGSEEIDVIEEDPEAELPDVEPPAVAPEVERRPEPQQAREPQPEAQQEAPPEEEPAPPPEEEEPAPEPEPAPVAEEGAAPPPPAPEVVQETPTVELPEEEDEEVTEDVSVTDSVGDEDSAIALDIDAGDAAQVTISGVPDGAVLSAGTDNGDGTWTLSAGELTGLTITPPADSDVDFTLSVTGDGASYDLDVVVNAVADAPTATAEDASGLEDTAIDLDLGSALTDIDGSESLSIVVSGVPDGAVLSAGTDNGDGTWTLTTDDFDGLTITPPQDFTGDIDMTLTATSTEADGGDTAVTEVPFTVTVVDVAETTDATTAEDTAVALDITYPEGETTGTISDIPDGAVLMSGGEVITITDGSAEVTADQLADLTITPPPDSDVDFTLSVTSGGTSADLDVTVTAVADAPTATAEDASGLEDTAIDLDLGSALTDIDGSESLSIVVSGVPDGAVLSAGTDNGDGTWTLTTDDFDGLTITPPEDYNGSFDLTVTSTATEDDGDTATTSGTLTVDVAAVDDEVAGSTLDVSDAAGTEDTAIGLNIDVTQLDTDGSESVSITVSGVPTGASLSAGTDNGDGTWTLDADDLDGLTVTPPADSNEDFTLGVSVTTTEANGGDTSTTSASIDVDVTGVSDGAELSVSLGDETATVEEVVYDLDLSATLSDTDGSETVSVTISDVPEGVTLSAGTDNGNGTWTLDSGDLDGLEMTVPDGTPAFDLTIAATATEDDGDSSTTTATISVDATDTSASEAEIDTTDASGLEDSAIALDIDVTAVDTDGSESMSITISDVPTGANLSAGTDNGDGTWTLDADDLDGLTITPPADSNADFTLGVSVTTTEASTGDTTTATTSLDVDVAGVADAPTLSVSIGEGEITTTGGEPVDVTIGSDNVTETGGGFTVTARSIDENGELTEASSDSISTNSNPPGFGVSGDASGAGTELGYDGSEGPSEELIVSFDEDVSSVDVSFAWLSPSESAHYEFYQDGVKVGEGTIEGGSDGVDAAISLSPDGGVSFDQIVFTAPGDGDDFLIHSIDFEATEGGETSVTYPLDITSGLTDTDGSETLSITVSDLPDGATLSAGTDNGDGSWTLSADDLDGLEITVTGDDPGQSFDLSVSATATEDDGDTATVSVTASTDGVIVDSTADGATVDAADASGLEDTAIALNIDVTQVDTDGSETLSITITDVPTGATLSAGTDNGDGSWTLDANDLDGLTVTPADDSSTDFTLGVSVTTTETSTGDTSTTSASLDVTVTGDADTPTLTINAASGDEDTSIDLDITSALTDTDGSETLSVTISDIPDGAVLMSGGQEITVTNGVAEVDPGQLADLSITPPADYNGSFDLTVTSTATEADGDTATTSGTLTVDVAAVDDEVAGSTLDVTDAAGNEDSAIALNIDVTQLDTDGSETVSITISDVPTGAALSAGTDNGDGTWTLDAGDLDGLTITPADDSNADFTLGVSVTTTETEGGATSTTSTTLDVDVTGVADAPTLSASTTFSETASGETSIDVPQDILDAATGDNTVTISGVPSGATLSAGTDNGDGSWTLDAGDVDGLSFTPADGSTDTVTLSYEVNGAGGSGETLTSENFNSGVSGWSGGYGSGGQMILQGDTSASKTFDFGSEHAGQTVTISFNYDANSEWEESGYYTDYFDVSANGDSVLSTTENSASTASFTVTLDENGQVVLEMATNTTASNEYMAIDNLTITSGDDWETTLATATGDVEPEPAGLIYDLDITSELTDTDGSETLSITVSDLPEGAELSAGTDNGDGTWTLTAGDLDGLQMTAPADSGDFDLAISATATESDGDTNTVSVTTSVSGPDLVADDPTLTTAAASGEEDRAIALSIDAALSDTDGSETLSITISDVPDGAVLSAGTDNGDGTWTLDAGDLDGLTITPAENSDADFTLGVSATTTESSTGDTSTVTSSVDVSVDAVADAAELTVSLGSATEVGGGASPVSYWKLDEDSGYDTLQDSVGDNDGTPVNTLKTNNETGVFDGAAEFSGGGKSSKEEYIEVDHSDDLKPENGALTLWFNADDIGGRNCLASSDSSGNDDGGHFGLWVENGQIHLRMQGDNSEGETNIYGGSVSTDEWNQVTVTWGDSGAKIYLNGELVGSDDNWTRGLEGNEEPWTFGANQWSSSDGTADNMTDFFNGHMDDIAIYDQQLDADDVAALYDNGVEAEMESGGDVALQYPLDITANLTDTDGSESVAITIEGLPDGAELSAGTDNGDGTWTLDSADLTDLTVTVPEGSDDFLLSVSATTTDTGGDTRTVTESVQVDVGSDGFDAGTTGTESADTITGTSGDDVISGMGGDDNIDAGAGDDTVLGGAGNDTIDGGEGNDLIEGGDGNDVIEGGAGDDDVMGGAGDDLFIFGSGDGADYFHGGDGWSDTIQIDGVDGGPGADAGWAMQVDEGVGYTETENGIEFDAEASGVITLDDGSELTFDGVEKLEW